jgi:hypothetical protein
MKTETRMREKTKSDVEFYLERLTNCEGNYTKDTYMNKLLGSLGLADSLDIITHDEYMTLMDRVIDFRYDQIESVELDDILVI